jgi:hypothetical protein
MNYYVCIFCGYHSQNILDFRLTTTKGFISRKMFVCPICKQVMKGTTLKRKMDAGEWAKYLYICIRLYKRDNYYDRISFPSLMKNVRALGIGSIFWEEWKNIKEEFKERTIHEEEMFDMLYDIIKDKDIDFERIKLDNFINKEKH